MVTLYSSSSRNSLSTKSDIDVRILREPGFANGISILMFSVKSIMIVFGRKIPLDLYVFDNESSLGRTNRIEVSIVLSNRRLGIDP